MPMMSNIDGSSGNSPGDLFQQIPPVSKVIIVSMVGLLFAVSIGIFSPDQYALVWPLVWNKFHAWRLLSCVLYPGSPNFFTLMQMFSIGMYSMRYEKDGFSMGGGGGSADFAFMFLFGVAVIETVMLVLFYQPLIFINTAILYYICYVWSRKNPTMSVSIWGVSINAVYVPWVLVSISMLLGASIFLPLLGIAVGHLFYFLVDVLPDLHDIDLLHTPQLFVKLLGWGTERTGVQMHPPARTAQGSGAMPARTGRSTWGTGRALGSS